MVVFENYLFVFGFLDYLVIFIYIVLFLLLLVLIVFGFLDVYDVFVDVFFVWVVIGWFFDVKYLCFVGGIYVFY